MAISNFNMGSAADEVISFAPFADFTFSKTSVESQVSSVARQQHSPLTTSSGSPDSSGIAALADGGPDEDDDDNSEDGDTTTKKRNGSVTNGPSKRGKANSAERRATHNAIERARRESLNGRFLELAGALPTMANVKRPSKSIIVNKSLEWIYESQIREHALLKENNALRAELNEMRARLHMPMVPNQASLAAQPQPSQYQSQAVPAMGMTADNFFGTLPGIHNPAHLPGFPPLNANTSLNANTAPPSAPANMLAFSNPFHSFEGLGEQATCGGGSPGSRSDSGSDAASAVAASVDSKESIAHQSSAANAFGSPHSISSVGESEEAAHAGLSSSYFAGLQATYNQQHQYAAVAAATNGHPHQSTNANWALMF